MMSLPKPPEIIISDTNTRIPSRARARARARDGRREKKYYVNLQRRGGGTSRRPTNVRKVTYRRYQFFRAPVTSREMCRRGKRLNARNDVTCMPCPDMHRSDE